MTIKTSKSPLDDVEEIKSIDKSNMLQFSIEAAKHYRQAARLTEKIAVNYAKPDNIIVAGMGGSAIGGELLKDYARNQAPVPIEVSKDYQLPTYAKQHTLVVVVSYSGDTEESLSAFLDAQRRKCMVYCVSSGGSLLEFAERLNVPHLRVPFGMPPRAASPYLLVPQLVLLEKMGLVSGVSEGLSEAPKLLEKVSGENAPEKPEESNPAKSLASGINDTVPVVYGFGIYRGVAQRWKQQFNENAKVPAKWEVFPELNHNEIVGWEKAGTLAKRFSTVFLRDKSEAAEVRSRIEITQALMQTGANVSKQFEVWTQGKSALAKMLSTILVGDFTSIYLAVLRGVDPTPVQTIVTLKQKLGETGTKEEIIQELEKLKPIRS
ncbi:MAG TPA: bifunctional phosphoglucose/phosphomannose isomerase [Candidatus Bathyarchaeia archaeon]|nr:bifunctional phosphoglucose/phosphomannose isomerase [Candidatus Bathyarchaeia archaeon]